LSERLKELAAEEIVVRTVHHDTPVRVEYRLTPRGEALTPVIQALAEWSERWLPAPAAVYRS
ncbi:MAG: winged helix-turn-helix transcriptional regulator, partial [Chloroflexi bacterium]|nr:winged helix-turn-helix transcriptional regulator [Chloroflexota bacterium]